MHSLFHRLPLMQIKLLFTGVLWVALTTDAWTSRATDSYCTVTAHWICPKMHVMKRAILCMFHMPGGPNPFHVSHC